MRDHTGSMTAYDGDHPGHPFRGNGHTGGVSGNPEAVVDRMMAHIMDKNGVAKLGSGFTVDAHTNADVKTGYAVDIFPARSKMIEAGKLTPTEVRGAIADWKNKNATLLADPRNRFKVGGWVDPKTGNFWLGATRVYGDHQRAQAVKMGHKANQLEVAHLTAIAKKDWSNAFIKTGGTGEPVKMPWDAKPSKLVLVLLEGSASAQQIHEAISKHLPKRAK